MSLSLLSVMHVNVNCSDLERSLGFYRDQVGLVPQSHTNPLPQDGAGFGLPGRVVWDAHLLHDDRGFASAAVDLLEWKEPKPIGEPFREAHHLGLFRMAFMVESAAAGCAELDRLGVEHSGVCWLEMGPEIPIEGLNAVFFRDPDGTCLELIETPTIRNSDRS
jgi:catechol 2,3-dioxygenase-like lactoylglutathione lyase family enzyme